MKKFQDIKKVVHLSAEKKSALWNSTLEKIHMSEALSGAGKGATTEQVSSSPKNKLLLALTAGISLLLVGGVSYAAETSLPGSFLYPIKIHIYEELQQTFTIGTQEEAELQLALIEKRLEEKNTLRAKGRLTPDLDTRIDTSIQTYTDTFDVLSDILVYEGNGDVAERLKLRLGLMLSGFFHEAQEQTDTMEDTNTQDDAQSKNSVSGSVSAELHTDIDLEVSGGDMSDTLGTTETSLRDALDGIDTVLETQGVLESVGVQEDTTQENQAEVILSQELESEIDSALDTLFDAMSDIDEDTENDIPSQEDSSRILESLFE